MPVQSLKQVGIVISIAAFVMLTNLGGPRLWDRDEPRNAGCAREMWLRSDWIVPTFNAELRTHKPVLLYWCMMLSYGVFGMTELAARLPSALCAIGSSLCVYFMGRRLFGPSAGVWAGIAVATSLMFVLAGRAATPDALLIFCTTLALTIYVLGTFRKPHAPREESISRSEIFTEGLEHYFPQHWPTVLAMYAATGLGVLAKGPVGFILPTAVIGMYLLIERLPRASVDGTSWRVRDLLQRIIAPFEPLHFLATCWAMRPLTAIFAVSAVALPWYCAVGLATEGEFLRGFFWEHNLNRATAVMEHHAGSVLFYPLAILVGFFPWSVFAVPVAIDAARRQPDGTRSAPITFALCWIGVYVVLFSLARTKLPSYVTPCYPALALLVGDYVDRWSRAQPVKAEKWLLIAFGSLALIGGTIAVAVPIAAQNFLPGEEWLGMIGLVPVAGGVACIGLVLARNYRAAAGTFAAGAVTFATLLFALGADRADRHQANHLLLQAIHVRSPQPQIASYQTLEPSWVFYGGLPIREFSAGNRRSQGDAAQQVGQFLASTEEAFVITTESRLKELSPQLPPQTVVLQSVPYFLKSDRLIVLGRAPPSGAPHAQSFSGPALRNDLR